MYVLGLSAFYHDSAACLLHDGEIVAAAQEERFTRRKGDASFPRRAAAYCLREAGITRAELELVTFYDKPLLKLERILETYLAVAPRGLGSFLRAAPLWMKDRLRIENQIREGLGGYTGTVLWAEHHESHAASAFFPSPFREAAVLTVDGVGEWATATLGLGRDDDLELWREIHWPDSLGLLYSAFTHFLGFAVNEGEYKVMGLAPYGEPRWVDVILREIIDIREDGSFTLDQRYFNYLTGLTMTGEGFERLFGGPRREPDAALTRREMDLARSVQEVCEEVVLRMARTARRETGAANLCMAGGVALNAVANGKIRRSGLFDRVWIQPAAGDAGGAVGAALLGWIRYAGGERVLREEDAMGGALLGPGYAAEGVRAELESLGAVAEELPDDELAERVAELLEGGQVVGWAGGRMEFGPRALGSRSILGDPRDPAMQSTLNRRIKFRESFRPFAPAVLAEHAHEHFELTDEAPYMVVVAPVREERRLPPPADGEPDGLARLGLPRSHLPAVTHVDYSARVQTVDRQRHPDLRLALDGFHARTGCPVLVNTSFNVRGEPIVCTPYDAYRCFMRTDMDWLVVRPLLLDKRTQPPWSEPPPASRPRWPELAPAEGRRFGAVLGVALLVVTALLGWQAHRFPAIVAGVGTGLLLLTAAVAPARLAPVRHYWMALGKAVSRITTPLVLGLLYFLGVTPVGLVARLVGHRPLDHGRGSGTAWIDRRDRLTTPESMEHQF